jgi:hypothetical protein
MSPEKKAALAKDFAAAINRHSCENESNTPDFVLADFLVACLEGLNRASVERENWYGKHLSIDGKLPTLKV